MIHLHKWLKWSRLVRAYGGNNYQFSSCSICGKIRHRNLGYLDGVNFAATNEALIETGFDPVSPPPEHDDRPTGQMPPFRNPPPPPPPPPCRDVRGDVRPGPPPPPPKMGDASCERA